MTGPQARPTRDEEARRIEGGLAAGQLWRTGIELAAWLGYQPARDALGRRGPCRCVNWIRALRLPALPLIHLEDTGRLPESDGALNEFGVRVVGRAIAAWCRAALDRWGPVPAEGEEDLAAPAEVLHAAERYLRAPRPENDISLGLMFNEPDDSAPFADLHALARLAARSAADPSPYDAAGQVRSAVSRAVDLLGSPGDGEDLFTAPMNVLRRDLVPWATGLGDPLEDPGVRRRLDDPDLWEPYEIADFDALLDEAEGLEPDG